MTAQITSQGAHPCSHPGVDRKTAPVIGITPGLFWLIPGVARCRRSNPNRAWRSIAVAIVVAGCSNPAHEARDRYEFLKKQHASLQEVCLAGKRMIQAYADAKDAEGYRDADIEAGGDCLQAELDGGEQRFGEAVMVADNMDVMADNVGAATQ